MGGEGGCGDVAPIGWALKWTPFFGPGVKVEPAHHEEQDHAEEDENETHARIQGQGCAGGGAGGADHRGTGAALGNQTPAAFYEGLVPVAA